MSATVVDRYDTPSSGDFPSQGPRGRHYQLHHELGAVDTPLTMAVPAGSTRRLIRVSAFYSAAVVGAQTVTPTAVSALGAGFNETLPVCTVANGATQGSKRYTSEEVVVHSLDSLSVAAPAGPAGSTVRLLVESEVLG